MNETLDPALNFKMKLKKILWHYTKFHICKGIGSEEKHKSPLFFQLVDCYGFMFDTGLKYPGVL